MAQQRIIDYREMWTTNARNYALLRVDHGYVIYDKQQRRVLMLEPHITQYIINNMMQTSLVDVWDDSAAAS